LEHGDLLFKFESLHGDVLSGREIS